jgi:hypothetical protein
MISIITYTYNLQINKMLAYFEFKEISIIKIIISIQFNILLGLLFIISGILLLLSKRFGWIFSLASWAVLILLAIDLYTYNDVTVTFLNETKSFFWQATLIILIAFSAIILLNLKYFRDKYANKKAYNYTILIVSFFILNKLFL